MELGQIGNGKSAPPIELPQCAFANRHPHKANRDHRDDKKDASAEDEPSRVVQRIAIEHSPGEGDCVVRGDSGILTDPCREDFNRPSEYRLRDAETLRG